MSDAERDTSETNALEERAIEEAFAREVARGKRPDLAEWMRRYPQHAAVLADVAADLLWGDAPREADAPSEMPPAVALSGGARRALAAIFGDADDEERSASVAYAPQAGALARVAELSAPYASRPNADLRALLAERGRTVASLAASVGLPLGAVEALAGGRVALGSVPLEVFDVLAAALDVAPEVIGAALAACRPADGRAPRPFADVLAE